MPGPSSNICRNIFNISGIDFSFDDVENEQVKYCFLASVSARIILESFAKVISLDDSCYDIIIYNLTQILVEDKIPSICFLYF